MFATTDIVDGKPVRVQRSHQPCRKDDKHHSRTCKPMRQLCDEFMAKEVNRKTAPQVSPGGDMPIAEPWEKHFLPFCEIPIAFAGKPRKEPSTMRGYRQIWRQHQAGHCGTMTLAEYKPTMGARFLESLTGTCDQRATHRGKPLARHANPDHALDATPGSTTPGKKQRTSSRLWLIA